MAKEVKEITIDESFAYCRQERIKGNGNKIYTYKGKGGETEFL